MRIWFDVLTPKQVMFFKYAVELLRQRDYEVLCTARNYRECVRLARLKKFELRLVGRHGGSSKYDKLRASSIRIFDLAKEIERFNPDLCISFSSPEAARVAFGLGIPHVTFSDSPHAQAVQKLTIPFVNYLLCPWIIPYSAWDNLGISRNQIVRYRALDPVAWLRKETKNIDSAKLKKKYQLSKSNTFVIRPEESKASYLIDKANNNVNDILKSIVQNFHDTTISGPNDTIQGKIWRQNQGIGKSSRRLGAYIGCRYLYWRWWNHDCRISTPWKTNYFNFSDKILCR